jgi:hypothetical protein
MTTPTFTTPPAVIPARGSSTFSTDASAWVTWQNAFEGELSTAMPWVALQVTAAADSVTDAATQVGLAADEVTLATAQVGLATAQVGLATTQADNAAASAAAAVVTANADLWVSGASYSSGDNVISEVDFGTYRSKTTHTGVATDPSADATNWTIISASAASFEWLLKSTTYTAATDEKIAADVTGGAWTLTLPPSPVSGAVVIVSVIDGDAAANNLTIDGNGNNIYGDTTLIYDVPLSTVWLVYNSTEWRLA